MRARAWTIALLAGLMAAPALLEAQRPGRPRPGQPPRPTTAAPRRPPPADTLFRLPAGDSLRRAARAPTSAGRDTTVLVEWQPPDSVTRELLERSGYLISRYQGDSITFDVAGRALEVRSGRDSVVAVQRADQLVVTDSVILYDQETGRVAAGGRRIVLRDPNSGAASDLVSSGRAEYDLRGRVARVTNPRFAVESGETWYVSAAVGTVRLPAAVEAAATDSAQLRAPTFYGLGGTLTSCDDSLSTHPHYHFAFKELKQAEGKRMFARPAVLYIRDVPVMWLPFVFQDMRKGRRNGILTPRFSITDIVRNNPNYRRQFENLGYYWALNDYMDASFWLDWRSGLGGSSVDGVGDPGWTQLTGEWRYRWLDRFVNGGLAVKHTARRDGSDNSAVSWQHSQEFSRNSRLSGNVNYVTSTQVQRQNAINPYQAMATIASNVNYVHTLGPAQVNVSGRRTQYPGRAQVDQTLPTLSVTTKAINLAEWLLWTPSFNYQRAESRNIDLLSGTAYFVSPDGIVGTQGVRRSTRNTSASFETPLQIFGYNLRNSFRFSDDLNDYPELEILRDVRDSTVREERVFARKFNSQIDWSPSFALPSFSPNRWNIAPSVAFQNVELGRGFMIRNHRTNGRWVRQSKRPVFSLGVSPNVYGFFPGFGPFSALRHSLAPGLSYSLAPAGDISDEFLFALGRTRHSGYFADLRQSAITLSLTQSLEGKLRVAEDTANVANTTGGAAQNVKLLRLDLDALSYDFERAKAARREFGGLTTTTSGYSVSSDLLPGVQVQVRYDLFQGDPMTDTAVFKPFRNGVQASFSLSPQSNPFVVLARLFGRAAAPGTPNLGAKQDEADERYEQQLASQPVAGSRSRDALGFTPPVQGWNASFTFSSTRSRPLVGNATVLDLDPEQRCASFRDINMLQFQECVNNARNQPSTEAPPTSLTLGGPVYRTRDVSSLGANMGLAITRYWSATWNTNYDLTRREFATHTVGLQRELHDWRATFHLNAAPNGNFAFGFFVALKAQPELKFDYNRASYRSGGIR